MHTNTKAVDRAISDSHSMIVSVYKLSEPVGSKAPTLTGTLKGGWMNSKAASSVVQFCPAQGYPVPLFR